MTQDAGTPQVTITIRNNGPVRVEVAEGASVALMDHEGNPIPVPGPRFSLCRCGASLKKPFCDGTHKTNGFNGSALAVTAEGSVAGAAAAPAAGPENGKP
jgi:CDGSH-type Zn-finger protein